MKSKYLIATVLVLSLFISIPIVSSASNVGYFVSGYYQCSMIPDFSIIGDDDYYIEAQFTLPYGDGTTYTSIGIFGSLGIIGYQSGSNTFTTVYQNGAWTDYKYRVVDFGNGIYLSDTNYNDLILFIIMFPLLPKILLSISGFLMYHLLIILFIILLLLLMVLLPFLMLIQQ